MQKTAGANYKQVDFLSERNMTWTSKPPTNEGVKRMGVKDRNFPKQIGSTVMAGVGGSVGVNGAVTAINAVSSMMSFEGGAKEMSTKDRILQIK